MAYAKTSLRKEKRELREKMRGLGLGYRDIAAELARRYRLRPRAAWREAYGWSLQEAADQVNAFRGQVGLDPGGFAGMTAPHLCEYENWPRHGQQPTGRRPTPYLLAVLAAVYDCAVTDLVDLADREHLPPADLLILDKYSNRQDSPSAPQRQGNGSSGACQTTPSTLLAEVEEPGAPPGDSLGDRMGAVNGRAVTSLPTAASGGGWIDVRRLVMAAADESAEWASADAGRLVPPLRIEQMREDVQRLARTGSAAPSLALLAEARHLRDQAYGLVGRTSRPGQLTDLYVVAGQSCALMAMASFHLGVLPAAIEQVHAALVFAGVADHRSLQAWSRGTQGLIANWCGRPLEAVELVTAGLAIAPPGTARARLYCILARAWAHLSAPDQTREALAAADGERNKIGADGTDNLHDGIAGEFGWEPARQSMCSANALLRINDLDGAAERAAETINLHATNGTGSLVRSMQARADLASAELARGQLDAAEAALAPVWSLPSEYRWHSLVKRLEAVASHANRPAYLRTSTAKELAERITDFADQSRPRSLPAAPSGLAPRG